MSDILQGLAAFAVFGVIIYASSCLAGWMSGGSWEDDGWDV